MEGEDQRSAPLADLRSLPAEEAAGPNGLTRVTILGVDYLHVHTRDGGDLYLTRFGRPYLDHLKLKNWRDDEWFSAHRQRLNGTSTVYRVPSKVVHGRSINLVVKWNRVGEEVPLDTFTFDRFSNAEFNSPYEEFALLMELRSRRQGGRMRTNRPLAIYVPPEQLKLWQTGRSKSKMAQKRAKYRDVELDIFRQYIVIYEWVDGVSADEAFDDLVPDRAARDEVMAELTDETRRALQAQGFLVADHKPAHIILRHRPDGRILTDRHGKAVYAIIDFELLSRTPEYEREVEQARRRDYLRHQEERFQPPSSRPFPRHLKPVETLDVDYVWGSAESTHGMLWVVGRDPDLFDYFLPERWRHTQRTRLSKTNETYYTVSKDHINLVWKVSRVGERPAVDPGVEDGDMLVARGYNSPFEEFSIALELARKGFSTVYPRAIYMAGIESPRAQEYVVDNSRFDSHRRLKTPDGRPLLSREHNYLTIWGYWRCLDDWPGREREPDCVGVSLVQACQQGLIQAADIEALLARKHRKLAAAGFEANLKPTHFLLSRRPDGSLRRDRRGDLVMTICNFELIRRRH